jgi:serine/threonine protein kinase
LQIEQITKSKYDENLISNEYSPELKSLITSMLTKSATARPSVNEVLKSVLKIYRKKNWIPRYSMDFVLYLDDKKIKGSHSRKWEERKESDKDVYEGQYSGDRREGKGREFINSIGICYYSNGTYEGDWRDDKRNGNGKS